MNYKSVVPDILLSAKSLGGGKSSISSYTCRDHIFKKAYDNLKDATLHSTTYNGFGEETITAIEAINIMIEDNYQKKSETMGSYISLSLNKIKEKYPNIIGEVRGKGCLQGIVITSGIVESIFSSIGGLIPISFLKDKMALKKILVSSIIFHLYEKYDILTFYGSNKGIPLKISPSLIINKEEVDYFISSLDETLKIGLTKLVLNFVKSKFFNK